MEGQRDGRQTFCVAGTGRERRKMVKSELGMERQVGCQIEELRLDPEGSGEPSGGPGEGTAWAGARVMKLTAAAL